MGDGLLSTVITRLAELEGEIHDTLNVYPYWRPDVELPAVWNWLTPGDTETPPVAPPGGQCRLRNLARITVTIAADPTAVPGEGDMLDLAAYIDAAVPIIAGEVYGRDPFGQREARMRGFATVADRLGDASILTAELPLEVYLDRTVNLAP